jgi:hypothetical protein
MRRAYCCILTAFVFLLGCAQNQQKTYGFPGKHQESFQPASRDYDQRAEVDDDALDYRNGNYDPIDPDPDFLYL